MPCRRGINERSRWSDRNSTPTRITEILNAVQEKNPKQRHTVYRIFQRLCIEHDYTGGYTVIKDVVREHANDYSVPVAFCHRDMLIKTYIHAVVICHRTEVIT